MSGIKVEAEKLGEIISRINRNCKVNGLRWAIFKINKENTEVIEDSRGKREESWEDFTTKLSKQKPCYAVFDLEYHNNKNGIDTNKMITILWRGNASEGTIGIKEKMLISSTLRIFQQNLALQGGVFQAGDEQELEKEEVIEFANRF